MKRIIHLSDTHIGSTKDNGEPYEGNLTQRFNNLIQWLNTTSKLGDRKDYVIVITGDICHDGKEEYFLEVKKLLSTLHKDFEVFLVPGNHDYRTKRNGCFPSPDIAAEEFSKLFYDTISSFPRRAKQVSVEKGFPRAHIIGGNDAEHSIAFIGLDSGEERKGEFSGKLGGNQLNSLKAMLNDNSEIQSCKYKVIYLHHDPFKGVRWWRIAGKGTLKDKGELLGILYEQATLLLYGHTHKVQSGDIDEEKFEQYGIKGIYNGGTSTGRRKNSTFIRIIDLQEPDNPDENTIPQFWDAFN